MGMTRRSVLLTGENIWKEYPMGKNQALQVLKGVDIEIRQGEFVVIVGPSGSGKSTLLHLLGGLDRPTDGIIKLGEQNVFAQSEDQLAVFRNRSLGFIFQFHPKIFTISFATTSPLIKLGGTPGPGTVN